MKRRRRHVGEWLQRWDERRQHSVAAFLEEHELSFLGDDLGRRDGLFDVAVDAQDDSCALPFELDRLAPGPLDLLSSLEAS